MLRDDAQLAINRDRDIDYVLQSPHTYGTFAKDQNMLVRNGHLDSKTEQS